MIEILKRQKEEAAEDQTIQEEFGKVWSFQIQTSSSSPIFSLFRTSIVYTLVFNRFQTYEKELSAEFDELDVDDFDPEEVLKMMDPEERRAFEQAVKENTLVQTIRANIEPWVRRLCFARHKILLIIDCWYKLSVAQIVCNINRWAADAEVSTTNEPEATRKSESDNFSINLWACRNILLHNGAVPLWSWRYD